MKKVMIVLLTVVMLATLVGCEDDSYRKDRAVQEDIMSRAQTNVPVYQPQHFLAREAINEYMRRMDSPDKLWYIYLMTESGAYIGYHITRTYPLSIAVAMSNPVQVRTGPVVVPAPGVDGVYYNGVDASLYYAFDAETDALIMWTVDFVAYDQPLQIDVPRLHIESGG